jgi:hypothetical protein
MKRSGIAELPLHSGKAPPWLFKRMVKLSRAVVDYIVFEYSEEELLRRLASPFWFQAFACALGFDWHSSGTTTTTTGALKLALSPEEHGIALAGGKGKTSRRAPEEIAQLSETLGLASQRAEELIRASRLSAKVDNACVQDGYTLYHHAFIFTQRGEWCVVQQGMHERYARRYHWLSEGVKSFTCEPHSGIASERREQQVLNLVAKQSEEVRKASVDLVKDNPLRLRKYLKGQLTLADFSSSTLAMPARHAVLRVDISEKGWQALAKAYEIQPSNYEELVALRGLGAKTLRALALLSELLFGAECDWQDPVKYSFAHGGKDGFPYPVDRENYDRSISLLKEALEEAKLGKKEKYHAIARLKDFLNPE